jgi:mitochondrial import receptor subunit TOM70
MSDRPIPVPPIPNRAPLHVDTASAASSSLWDRITTWASEHKAVVYTIAGVTLLVTAGGVYYYVSDSSGGAKPAEPTSEKKKSKKAKQKAKKEAEEAQKKEKEAGMELPMEDINEAI